MPAWALTAGTVTGRPPSPPLTGLVQQLEGDIGLTLTGVANHASAWTDQSIKHQDVAQANPGNQPYALPGDVIDGVQCVSFGVAGDANKSFITAANFVDRLGIDMDGAHARTIAIVARPRFGAAYGITGGKPWSIDNSWCTMFELNPNFVADGAYAWEVKIDDYANALQWTPQTNGALGPYNDVPTLAMWFSAGFPDFEFRVNAVQKATVPPSLYGVAGGVGPASISINGIPSYQGAIAGTYVYDFDLRTSPFALAQFLAYLKFRFPSLVI